MNIVLSSENIQSGEPTLIDKFGIIDGVQYTDMKTKHLLVTILSAVGVVVSGILGWIIGAMIGGNIPSDFTYQGLPGYEGTGMLGFHIGVGLGVLAICAALWRQYQKRLAYKSKG